MNFSSYEEHLILENQRLIHHLVRQLGVTPNCSEYDDLVSIGEFGLIKAANTFDLSKNIKFSAYASKCIKNEIFQYYRKNKKHVNCISLNEYKEDNEKLTLYGIISDHDSDFIEKIEENEVFVELVNIILNYLKGINRLVILYRIAGISQRCVSKKLNISQTNVSRSGKKAISEIQKAFNSKLYYKEIFSMSLTGDEYRISFSSKDVGNFKDIFENLLKNMSSDENLLDFKVNFNKDRIIIQLSAVDESFCFIAKIIQEIDNFSIRHISNNILKKSDDDLKNVDKEHADKTNKTTKCSTLATEKRGTILQYSNNEHAYEGTFVNKSRQVIEYMLTIREFSIQDLKGKFPNFGASIIANALYIAKENCIITSIAGGKYRIND